ncbi:PspA domain-containing protein [Actinokineospora xionganensis]|uniref:PspA domain-containing protein n=1 Tax=Actinokineospora xionganensis TaxID=2684470 RepID=A0ABR7KZJ7_9PSEU|nr:PspA domain-containing protein [Actinokineospora xionganensis]MBC6445800.1 PspA domain-containing protein [Actinokineospora xionganensis]
MTGAQGDDSEVVDAEVVDDPTAAPPVVLPADYSESGVPSFDYVRDRIEARVNTSGGSVELASAGPEAKSIDEQQAEREEAGRAKLAEIRRSMGLD